LQENSGSRPRLDRGLGRQTHGRLAQLAKRDRIPLAASRAPQRQLHSMRRPGGCRTLASSLGGRSDEPVAEDDRARTGPLFESVATIFQLAALTKPTM